MMLLKQMKYFTTIVECGSFTEAAMQCYISQSAISQQIQALETDLQVQLKKKKKRHIELTEAGKYFYRHAKAVLKEVEHITEETKRLGEDHELTLRIGYPKNFSLYELQQAITQFYDLYPEVKISIVSGTHEELYELLLQGKIDLKVSEQRRTYNQDYYNDELKYSESYVEIASVHPMATKQILTTEDLKSMSCILVVSKGYEQSEKNFYEKDLGLSHQFLYVDSLEQARLMVAGHRGYLPIDVIGHMDIPVKGIKRIPLYKNGKPVQRNYFVCWNKKNTNYYIEEFVHLLKEVFQQ